MYVPLLHSGRAQQATIFRCIVQEGVRADWGHRTGPPLHIHATLVIGMRTQVLDSVQGRVASRPRDIEQLSIHISSSRGNRDPKVLYQQTQPGKGVHWVSWWVGEEEDELLLWIPRYKCFSLLR